MRLTLALVIALVAAPLFGADFRIHRDLPYTEPRDAGRLLDVYTSTATKNAPVVVWIHGGGWQSGDKSDVAAKPWAFVDHGFVFISVNYRFIPAVTMTQIAQDVAKAVGWSHAHARSYGGDPQTIFIMGHSAGASLTALLCTDERYLKSEVTPMSVIKGCVPVDGDAFDVPLQVQTVEERRKQSFRSKFGDPDSQKALSAVTYISPGKSIPPFLILRVADPKGAAMRTETGSPCCPETDMQADRLAKALGDAGVTARIVPGAGKNHTTLDAGLGLPDDKPTEALFEFLKGALQKK